MPLDLDYYRKIQNSYGFKTAREKQIRELRYKEEKNFNKTFGTQPNCFKLKKNMNPDIDNNYELISLMVNKKSKDSEKRIISRNINGFYIGDIFKIYNKHYIVTSIDENTEIHTKGTVVQCNIKLRWIDIFGNIIVRYGYAEASSSDGQDEGKQIIQPDNQQKIQLTLDKSTNILTEGQRIMISIENEEFLNDCIQNDIDIPVFELTNKNYINQTYDGSGIISFVYIQTVFDKNTDSKELQLCDIVRLKNNDINNENCNLLCNKTIKENYLKQSVTYKFYCEFVDNTGNIINDVEYNIISSADIVKINKKEGFFNVLIDDNKSTLGMNFDLIVINNLDSEIYRKTYKVVSVLG